MSPFHSDIYVTIINQFADSQKGDLKAWELRNAPTPAAETANESLR